MFFRKLAEAYRNTVSQHASAIHEANAIIRWLAVCYMVDRYVFHLSMTHGPSMLPTLNEMGDVVVVDKLTPRFSFMRPIRRGDIVIADSSYRTNFTVCKRVIALAGDVVDTPGRDHPVVVPDGHVWLEGDNPHNSVDSRAYGPVPEALLRGRVACRIWPLTQARFMGPPGEVPERPAANTLYLQAMMADKGIESLAAQERERAARRAEELQAAREELAMALREQLEHRHTPGHGHGQEYPYATPADVSSIDGLPADVDEEAVHHGVMDAVDDSAGEEEDNGLVPAEFQPSVVKAREEHGGTGEEDGSMYHGRELGQAPAARFHLEATGSGHQHGQPHAQHKEQMR